MTLTITLNGESVALTPGSTVADLVADLVSEPRGAAVAVNGEVVRRDAQATTPLVVGDNVEIVRAVQGG